MDAFDELIRPGEFWIEHQDFPGYLIGMHGAVISTRCKLTPKILSPIKLGEYDGYQLRRRDGILKKKYRHHLVAEIAHGPRPDGTECCHNDGNRRNCDYSNLRWDTHKGNEADKIRVRPASARLTETMVQQMREIRRNTGTYYGEIARLFGVSPMTAHRAITGKSWRNVK